MEHASLQSTRTTAGGCASKPSLGKPASKKAAGAGSTAAASAGPADNDDAALAGGTLSDNDLREKMLELLGEVVMTDLQVTPPPLSHSTGFASPSNPNVRMQWCTSSNPEDSRRVLLWLGNHSQAQYISCRRPEGWDAEILHESWGGHGQSRFQDLKTCT